MTGPLVSLPRQRSPHLYDPLTDLATPDLFLAMLEAASCRASRAGHPTLVILVALGLPPEESHDVAGEDRMIRGAAGRLRHVMRRADFLGRVGRQTFAILVGDQITVDVDQVLRKIRNAFHLPVELDDGRLVSQRIRVKATSLDDGQDPIDAIVLAAQGLVDGSGPSPAAPLFLGV